MLIDDFRPSGFRRVFAGLGNVEEAEVIFVTCDHTFSGVRLERHIMVFEPLFELGEEERLIAAEHLADIALRSTGE